MSFIYFIPGVSRVTPIDLRDAGLEYLIDDPLRFEKGQVDRGPLGAGAGMLFKISGAKCKMSTAPDTGIEWRKCYSGKFYLGWDGEVDPVELQKTTLLDGLRFPLLEGCDKHWILPVVKACPKYYGIDDEGNRAVLVTSKYRPLIDIAEELRKDENELNTEMYLDAALRALQWNYRIGPYEIDTLQLITTFTAAIVCLALLDRDYPGESEAETKKKDAEE